MPSKYESERSRGLAKKLRGLLRSTKLNAGKGNSSYFKISSEPTKPTKVNLDPLRTNR